MFLCYRNIVKKATDIAYDLALEKIFQNHSSKVPGNVLKREITYLQTSALKHQV